MNIRQTDLVLEIGSGDNPHPRADILCDRYITTNHERAGGFRIRIDRPMVVADGMRLPFADKTFDYVIASHIFEHMDDPQGFAREIVRVGKAGFIEVPSSLSERVFGWSVHHWYGELGDGVLTFTRKNEGERWDGFFHRLISRNVWFRRFFEAHEDEWYVRLTWKEKISIQLRMRRMSLDEFYKIDERAWNLLVRARPAFLKDMAFAIRFFFRRVLRKTRKSVRKFRWSIRKCSDWMRLIVCPQCQGMLRRSREKMECGMCKTDYPIDGAIPILLLPDEIKKGY